MVERVHMTRKLISVTRLVATGVVTPQPNIVYLLFRKFILELPKRDKEAVLYPSQGKFVFDPVIRVNGTALCLLFNVLDTAKSGKGTIHPC